MFSHFIRLASCLRKLFFQVQDLDFISVHMLGGKQEVSVCRVYL